MGNLTQPTQPSESKPPTGKTPVWVIPPIVLLACWLLANVPGILPDSGKIGQINRTLPLFLAFVAFAACFYFTKWPGPVRAFAGIVLFLIVYLGANKLLGPTEDNSEAHLPTDNVRPKILSYQPTLDFDVIEKGIGRNKIYLELKPCDRSKAAYPNKLYAGETTQKGWNPISISMADVDWPYIKVRKGISPPCFEVHVYQLSTSDEGIYLGTIVVQ